MTIKELKSDNSIKQAVKEIIEELKKEKLIKENKQTPYQKTEILLYSYQDYIKAIEEKKKIIKEIQQHGLKQKSKSVVLYGSSSGNDKDPEYEKIQAILNSINLTKRLIALIDSALNTIKDDEYYYIIEQKYFKKKTFEDISEEVDKDVSTISRNRSRLINKISILLFSDEVLSNLFSQ